jgi:hypothetical protein
METFEHVYNLTPEKKAKWLKKKFIDVYNTPSVKLLECSSDEMRYLLRDIIMLLDNDKTVVSEIATWDDNHFILQAVKSAVIMHYIDPFVEGENGFRLMDREGSFVTTIAMLAYH